MKVDLMYSIRYIEHPWDEALRKQGVKAYCLCQEVRIPPEGLSDLGIMVSFKPVALFNYDSDGMMFEEFCYAEQFNPDISPRPEFIEMKKSLASLKDNRKTH